MKIEKTDLVVCVTCCLLQLLWQCACVVEEQRVEMNHLLWFCAAIPTSQQISMIPPPMMMRPPGQMPPGVQMPPPPNVSQLPLPGQMMPGQSNAPQGLPPNLLPPPGGPVSTPMSLPAGVSLSQVGWNCKVRALAEQRCQFPKCKPYP